MTSTTCPVSSECISNINKFKDDYKGKSGSLNGDLDSEGLIFKLSEGDKEIIMDSTIPKGKSYGEFVNDLPQNEGRYAIVHYKTSITASRNEILFVVWTPTELDIKKRMSMSMNTKSLTKLVIDLVPIEVIAQEKFELSKEEMEKKLSAFFM